MEWSYKIFVKKDQAPPNYVGRTRSNLNVEVIFKVKKTKNAKLEKNAKSFLAIFGTDTGHKSWNFAQYLVSLASTLLFL